MARLHALQGRENVECPKCGHALSLHVEGRCSRCATHVRSEGYSTACTDARLGVDGARMRAPYALCATREDDNREVCPDGGGACDPGACEVADGCPGPVPLDLGEGR